MPALVSAMTTERLITAARASVLPGHIVRQPALERVAQLFDLHRLLAGNRNSVAAGLADLYARYFDRFQLAEHAEQIGVAHGDDVTRLILTEPEAVLNDRSRRGIDH